MEKKEAMKILKDFHDKSALFSVRTALDTIIPELKESEESEDERIRKALLELMHDTTGDELWVDYNVHKEDAIDWLEKQGEQKPTIEMKSAEESLGIDSETYNKIVDECIYGDDERKPVETEKGTNGNDREIPFSEQEWSEEDGKMLEDIVSSINHESVIEGLKCRGINYSLDTSARLMENLINWLKSLKERYSWKPSDEQINALDDVISSRNIKYDVLSELWKDLKKLREE